MKTLNIAVIGAGAAGLCAARHIAAKTSMTPVVFEQASTVGGAWCYTDEIDKDKFGLKIHSAMYKNLKTNLPKEVMEFPDFPFDAKYPSFMTHEQVREYLLSYCKHFGLEKYIKFETLVRHVKPVSRMSGHAWEITVEDLQEKTTSTALYDAVLICNGHYAKPHIPSFPGDQYFKGSSIHSHSYRKPELFSEKRVLVLGCRSSGQDISLDIAKHAKHVIISHRTLPLTCPLPANVSQASSIAYFEDDGMTVCFEDGKRAEVDAFVYCTGYEYSFPFLDESSDVTVDRGRICYLYNHMINPSFPSLMFIGICSSICPFPQFHFQVLYCLAVLDGSLKLPSKAGMLKDIEIDYQDRLKSGMPHRRAHRLGPKQWPYNDSLADAAQLGRLHPRVPQLYKVVDEARSSNLCRYKESKVRLLDDGFYEIF